MDYYESAQIGGYRIEMPFPQLFYPEINSANKCFNQALTSPGNVCNSSYQSDFFDARCKSCYESMHDRCNSARPAMDSSPFQSDFFDSGCKQSVRTPNHSPNIDYHPQNVSNDQYGYRSYANISQRARARRIRNGLYSPNDCADKQGAFPQYEGDPMAHSIERDSVWQ